MKICIIGSGLTSLILAKNLIKKNLYVDIIYENYQKEPTSARSIGITNQNFQFLENLFPNLKSRSFSIKEIQIFNHNDLDSALLKFRSNKINQMYMFKYHEIYNYIINEVKNLKKLKKIKKNLKILDLNYLSNKYDLIIDTNLQNKFSKKYFYKKIKKDYFSKAYVTILHHDKINNSVARQIFTKTGPIAFLPISNDSTSIVISHKKSIGDFDKSYIEKLITKYNKFYNNLKFTNIQNFDLKFSLLKSYYSKNILAFGDKLHQIHPLAGQGFNMNIRDIKYLSKEIDQKISLGLLIDNTILEEFQNRRKSNNTVFAGAIDFIYEFFQAESRAPKFLSKKLFNLLNNSKLLSRYSSIIADKGI